MATRVCAACGRDMRRKWSWETYGRKVICFACGSSGYATFSKDGDVVIREVAKPTPEFQKSVGLDPHISALPVEPVKWGGIGWK